MSDQSITLFPGDTLTVVVSAGQAPDATAPDAAATADPNAPTSESAPAAGVVETGDVQSVGGEPPA